MSTLDDHDGFVEAWIPWDFDTADVVHDDDLLEVLVHPMPEGVTITCLMDCSHTGSMMDLPFHYLAPDENDKDDSMDDDNNNNNKNNNSDNHRSVFRKGSFQLISNIVREGLEQEQDHVFESSNSSFQSFLSAFAHGLKDEEAFTQKKRKSGRE